MTDNEIINDFEKEIKYVRENEKYDDFNPIVDIDLCEDILELIKRYKAENERLQEKSIADDKLLNTRVSEAIDSVSKANQKYVDALEKAFNDKVTELKTAKAENEKLRNALMGECMLSACSREKEIKSEAIKEFAEKLKEKCYEDFQETYEMLSPYVTDDDIDNLVKEMTEGNENDRA